MKYESDQTDFRVKKSFSNLNNKNSKKKNQEGMEFFFLHDLAMIGRENKIQKPIQKLVEFNTNLKD